LKNEKENFLLFYLIFTHIYCFWLPEKDQPDASIAKEESKKRFNLLINKLDQRNPFSKEHEGIYRLKAVIGNLELGGIFYDGKKPMAIINDQIVGVGDIIEEKQILKITQREVILNDLKEGRIYKLEVIK
jgi:hypothetical protein